jgi:hypothetical protein
MSTVEYKEVSTEVVERQRILLCIGLRFVGTNEMLMIRVNLVLVPKTLTFSTLTREGHFFSLLNIQEI